MMTFGDHLEVLRQMLFRIMAVTAVIAVVVFCCKETTWQLLLAPSEWDFCTYRWLEDVMQANLDKLASRKERGVIHGDGDNR